MTTLQKRLGQRLGLLTLGRDHKKKSLTQSGFTLVELMIVIVIVGILSAVALPNFLSQTDKAKATEAKTNSSAYLKQYYAANQESTAEATAVETDACPGDSTNWTYTCTANEVVASGADSMAGKSITSSVDLDTGAITIGAITTTP